MSLSIPDFTDQELDVIKQTVAERFNRPIEIHLADTELKLNPESEELMSCPAVYWQGGDCNFVINKVADNRFQCQFFYNVHEQFGTDIKSYGDIVECVVAILQVQADHELKRKGV